MPEYIEINGTLFVIIAYILTGLAVFGFFEMIDILIYLYKHRKNNSQNTLCSHKKLDKIIPLC